MKLLAVSDVESKAYWNYYDDNQIRNTDLILSCGDLDPDYLSFLVTLSNLPLLYVHGNHDDHFEKEPSGCICIDDRIFVYHGIRILGLGGSVRYREGKYMYTERAMNHRIRRLTLQLQKYRGFDILLTHSPALGLGDQSDYAHRGFACFLPLLEKYSPKYMVHGHVHLNYAAQIPREITHGNTRIINAFEKYEWEY